MLKCVELRKFDFTNDEKVCDLMIHIRDGMELKQIPEQGGLRRIRGGSAGDSRDRGHT